MRALGACGKPRRRRSARTDRLQQLSRLKTAGRGGLWLVFAPLTISLSMGIAYANSEGPPPGVTGAPGGGTAEAEPTCQMCHRDSPLNPDTLGKVALIGVPSAYVPGQTYRLTLELKHPTAKRWGFQVTALTKVDLQPAGDFSPLPNDTTTQRRVGIRVKRIYIEHGLSGGAATGVGRSQSYSWQFNWMAPKESVGNIEFFAIGNMANGNGDLSGDMIYTVSPEPIAESRADN